MAESSGAINGTSTDENYIVNVKIIIALNAIITVLTIVGNGVFLLTLVKRRYLHTPSNILLGALSASDLSVGIVAQSLWNCELAYELIISVDEKNPFSLINYIALWFFVFLSFVYISAVSLDRYAAVCYPIPYHARTTCKTHAMLAGFLLIASIVLYSLGQFVHIRADTDAPYYLFIALMGLSVVMTAICNYKIFKVIRKQQKEIRSLTVLTVELSNTRTVNSDTSDLNKALVIAIIAVLLFLCYFPMILVEGIFDPFSLLSKATGDSNYLRYYWSQFFVMMNSFVNPVVYYARMKKFRRAAKEVFCLARKDVQQVEDYSRNQIFQ